MNAQTDIHKKYEYKKKQTNKQTNKKLLITSGPSKTRPVSQFREPEERKIVYEHFAETNVTVLHSLVVAVLEKPSDTRHLKSETSLSIS